MTRTKQDFNNTPAGIATLSAITAVISYRSVLKDPQKVLRIRKRGPFFVLAGLAVAGAAHAVAQRSDDPKLRQAAQESGVNMKRLAISGVAVNVAGIATAQVLLGGHTQVSARRALAYVALTTAYGVASRLYNRAALPTVEVVDDLVDDERLQQELEELVQEVRNKDANS